MVTEKIINPIIIFDWYTGHIRLVKRLPRKIKVSEIPCTIKITFSIPEPVSLSCEGTVEIPMAKTKEMIINQL